MNRVVVVGGGVIGVACAHYLQQAGFAVTVIDQSRVGGGCSHANCGFVCPSHVLPLAGPRALWSTLKTLAQPDSPLRVKPRFDPTLWNWFWKFAKRCNRADMLAAGRATCALLHSSRQLYDILLQQESLDVEWQTKGLLFVFQSAKAFDHYAKTDRLLRAEFQMAAKRYDARSLTDLEPALKPGLAGGYHYECDAHLRPDKLMASWRQSLESRGVLFRENCTARNFSTGFVETDAGPIPADCIVVATGAWTPQLNRQLGCRVPVQPGKGYSLTMPRPAICPAIPLIFEEHRVAVTPMQTGYRIGSTMEFAGYDATMNPRRLDLLRRGAGHYLQQPTAQPELEAWWGWRPMVFDGIPIIGRVPKRDNLWIATGHGMLGLSMAPATGKLIAELIAGRPPHIDATPYELARFGASKERHDG